MPLKRIRAGFAAVLHGQAHISGCFIDFRRRRSGFRYLHERIYLSFCPCHLYYLLQLCSPKNIKLPCKFILPAVDDFHRIV